MPNRFYLSTSSSAVALSRVCLVTLLLWVLGVALVAEYTSDVVDVEKTARTRVLKLAEPNLDQDPVTPDPLMMALFALVFCAPTLHLRLLKPIPRQPLAILAMRGQFARAPPLSFLP